jgi:hypothetical protein
MIRILLLFISICFGETHVGLVQMHKENINEDYAIIYTNSEHKNKEDILIFDNEKLQGQPAFKVLDDSFVTASKKYLFKESLVAPCNISTSIEPEEPLPVCTTYNFIPVEFVRVYMTEIAIAISEIKNGVAVLKDKNKKYYFKFNEGSFVNVAWRYYKDTKFINHFLNENKSFNDFVLRLDSCILNKSFKCLGSFLSNKIEIEEIKKNAQLRAFYSTEQSCAEDKPEEKALESMKIDFIWQKIHNVLSLKPEKMKSLLQLSKAGSEIYLNITIPSEKPTFCENTIDVSMHLLSLNNKWQISYLRFYAEGE